MPCTALPPAAVAMPPNQRCAFVTFGSPAAARRALEALNGRVLHELTGACMPLGWWWWWWWCFAAQRCLRPQLTEQGAPAGSL